MEELIRRGYDERTASHYVALVGDTPLLDEEGNTLVMDRDGTVLARLKDFP